MRANYRSYGFLLFALILAITGCANRTAAPIAHKSAVRSEIVTVHRAGSERRLGAAPAPAFHIVKRGDTLHSIAWRYGIDYRDVSNWNRLSDPNLIYVGQKLRLKAPSKRQSSLAQTGNTKPTKLSDASKTEKPIKTKALAKRVQWSWPANGNVQAASSALGTKGIEILGTSGAPIKAAAGGTVVYSGSGLRGYGQLIIVKHSEEFLSAYAHNERLLVAEGVGVKRGQRIAEMGKTDAKRVMLHFEIRRNGKAVEPLDYLPRRRGAS